MCDGILNDVFIANFLERASKIFNVSISDDDMERSMVFYILTDSA